MRREQAINRPAMTTTPSIERRGDLWVGRFDCMASPCEVLIECEEPAEARECIESGASFDGLFDRWRSYVTSFEASLEGVLLYHG